MTSNDAIPYLKGTTSETIIVKIAHILSTNGSVFALLAGLILAGILAATMSTADSQLLAAYFCAENLEKFLKASFQDDL